MAPPRESGVRAGDGIVFRTPLLPMTALLEWAAAGDAAACRRYLVELVDRPDVAEALYVASPSLVDALAAWRAAPGSPAGRRAEHAVVKYVARMMGRATPFGLFSGVSTGRLGRETRLELAPRSEYRRRTRLDNDYLFVLADELAKLPALRARLRYRPNTSIYITAGRLRYASARLDGKERSYHLVSVEITQYLEDTLERAARGATLAELAAALVNDEITADEAATYIAELVDAQLVVPELGIYVTGPEPLDGLIAQLRAAGEDEVRPVLERVAAQIAALDAAGVGSSPERYREIAAALEPLPAAVDRSRLFQVDMVKPAAATLSTRIAAELAQAIHQLARVSRMRSGLDEWKRAFRDRYEDRMVPLADVLDEESGIGFETVRGPGAEGAPLLAGLPFAPGTSDNRVSWSALDRLMLRRLSRALAERSDEIVLEPAELDPIALAGPVVLPDAFSAMIRLVGESPEPRSGEDDDRQARAKPEPRSGEDDDRQARAKPEPRSGEDDDRQARAKPEPEILFEGTTGPSGARILGRFCHASAELEAIVRAHHAAEEALQPAAAFAEIVHLNEGRIGNILCRPVLRGHEIVFLGQSGAPDDAQLRLDDLLVHIAGDRIVLRSRRLGREVVPRLTTAHNFRLRSLGVYRFLCALAGQNTDHAVWSWGALTSAPFLPRVRIGRVIVSRATWNLDGADLAPITAAVRAAAKQPARQPEVAAAVAALRDARRLPRLFAVAMADNELPIDLDNPLLAAAFADEVSGAQSASLIELLPAPDRLIVRGPEGAFGNEVVLTFTRQRPPDPAIAAPVAPVVRRELPPGSDWLYAKIYCGESTGDRVLREAIAPVARDALARGDASRWFFIRYADPEPHLRVRFAGDPAALAGAVLPALERAVAPLAGVGAVRKLVLDTYVREIERYGGDHGIELLEQLFWHDSEAVLGIVELLDGDAGAAARWKLALRGMDSLLDTLGFAPEARARIAGNARDMLGREMRADTNLWTRIGERFTRDRAELELVFARDRARDADHDLEPGFELLARRDAALADCAGELRRLDAQRMLVPGLADIAWSVCHMHANRLLHASQRAQEMVLYDFLRRLYAARKARGASAQP